MNICIFLKNVKTFLIGWRKQYVNEQHYLYGGRNNYVAKEGQMKFTTFNISTKRKKYLFGFTWFIIIIIVFM